MSSSQWTILLTFTTLVLICICVKIHFNGLKEEAELKPSKKPATSIDDRPPKIPEVDILTEIPPLNTPLITVERPEGPSFQVNYGLYTQRVAVRQIKRASGNSRKHEMLEHCLMDTLSEVRVIDEVWVDLRLDPTVGQLKRVDPSKLSLTIHSREKETYYTSLLHTQFELEEIGENTKILRQNGHHPVFRLNQRVSKDGPYALVLSYDGSPQEIYYFILE